MKSFPVRQAKQPSKKQDPLGSSPNTIALRPVAIGAPARSSASGSNRNRSVSEGFKNQKQRKSQSPVDPTILSTLSEEVDSVALPPPSPGTPPKKLWERQYGSFLRARVKSGGSLVQELQQQQLQPPSPPKLDTSVKGGKFFANVFRSSSDPSRSHRKSTSSSSTDELDGTMRRGAEKAYSPGNVRYAKSIPMHASKSAEMIVHSSSNSVHPSSQSMSTNSSSLPQRLVAVEDYPAIQSALTRMQGDDLLPPTLPFLLPPRTLVMQQQPQQSTATTVLNKNDSQLDRTTSSPNKSSAMKKAFTDFHNSTDDANSAYLGDDPSLRGHNLFWTQKNEQLVQQEGSSTCMMPSKSIGQIFSPGTSTGSLPSAHGQNYRSVSATGTYNSPLDTVQETVNIAKSGMRVLKQISGVEAWQSGRRYLIAPAALAACPVSAVTSLFGNSCAETQSAEHAALAVSAGTAAPPFGMIVLGECLLTYVTKGSTTRTVKQWSSAQLVLRQNYLLEYDVSADVRTSVPRGYAHLQYATTHLHEHFSDALELHFYGSPCAKADARVLMIRIVGRNHHHAADNTTSGMPLDDNSAHHRPEIREHWRTCLDRASSLTQVSDLYEYDETTSLGRGQYAEVRAARRRQAPAAEEKASGNGPTTGSSSSSPKYDCALKIFDKDNFWRMVVKGRERADTIVREASVQATLLARCGQNPSFLRIRGFFETADKVVLELELLEGTDLFKYISSKNVLKEPEAALILRDVLSCLDAMSKVGLAHRDVKPANILICREFQRTNCSNGRALSSTMAPRVKVGDFGMAAFCGVDGQVRGRCGTPGYVAPEIFTAGIYGGYGNKVDVFSAGVTLYVMLCGYEPFYGETDDELKAANKAAVIDFPSEDWANVSASAQDLVKQMMHADPAKRLDARQALQHPWIVKHLPESEEFDRSVSVPPNPRRDDACVVS
jgi:serine/threonine protein kinase